MFQILTTARVGQTISPIVMQAVSGVSPYQWSVINGNLPPGLNMAANGQISGTPTVAGAYIFTVRVTDSNLQTFDKEFIYHVAATLTIGSNSVPDGVKGIFYFYTVPASGGRAPYAWRLTTGSLPSGLTLDSATGTISGVPTTVQTIPLALEVRDNDSPSQVVQKTFTMMTMKLLGDVNGDSQLNLADAILAMQVVVGGVSSGTPVFKEAAFDSEVGLDDVMYIIQSLSGIRP